MACYASFAQTTEAFCVRLIGNLYTPDDTDDNQNDADQLDYVWNLAIQPAAVRYRRKALHDASPDAFGAMYLKGITPECFNEAELRDWIRNAPAKKPMYSSEAEKDQNGGKYRGMPNLNLTDDQIDQIVAYLLERK